VQSPFFFRPPPRVHHHAAPCIWLIFVRSLPGAPPTDTGFSFTLVVHFFSPRSAPDWSTDLRTAPRHFLLPGIRLVLFWRVFKILSPPGPPSSLLPSVAASIFPLSQGLGFFFFLTSPCFHPLLICPSFHLIFFFLPAPKRCLISRFPFIPFLPFPFFPFFHKQTLVMIVISLPDCLKFLRLLQIGFCFFSTPTSPGPSLLEILSGFFPVFGNSGLTLICVAINFF